MSLRAAAALSLAVLGLALGSDEVPRIDKIERLGPDAVTIHFDTLPDLNYALQYSDDALRFRPDRSEATWFSLFELPTFPFRNHFVIVDQVASPARVYRLSTTR